MTEKDILKNILVDDVRYKMYSLKKMKKFLQTLENILNVTSISLVVALLVDYIIENEVELAIASSLIGVGLANFIVKILKNKCSFDAAIIAYEKLLSKSEIIFDKEILTEEWLGIEGDISENKKR